MSTRHDRHSIVTIDISPLDPRMKRDEFRVVQNDREIVVYLNLSDQCIASFLIDLDFGVLVGENHVQALNVSLERSFVHFQIGGMSFAFIQGSFQLSFLIAQSGFTGFRKTGFFLDKTRDGDDWTIDSHRMTNQELFLLIVHRGDLSFQSSDLVQHRFSFAFTASNGVFLQEHGTLGALQTSIHPFLVYSREREECQRTCPVSRSLTLFEGHQSLLQLRESLFISGETLF